MEKPDLSLNKAGKTKQTTTKCEAVNKLTGILWQSRTNGDRQRFAGSLELSNITNGGANEPQHSGTAAGVEPIFPHLILNPTLTHQLHINSFRYRTVA